jgi:hypothetical protein
MQRHPETAKDDAVIRVSWIILGCILFGALGCEDKDRTPTPGPSPTNTSPRPTEQGRAEEKPAADDPTTHPRPKEIELTLSAARRAKIEAAVPEAKGFLVAKELEADVQSINKINKKPRVVRWLDEQATGKWVLFTAPYNNLAGERFELPFTYARKSKRDPFGMSQMWVFVEFEDVKGHHALTLNNGDTAVILAKYAGNLKASPGHDLVALGLW